MQQMICNLGSCIYEVHKKIMFLTPYPVHMRSRETDIFPGLVKPKVFKKVVRFLGFLGFNVSTFARGTLDTGIRSR